MQDYQNDTFAPREDIFAPLIPGSISGIPPFEVINPAGNAYENLVRFIKEFEAKLDDNHEIGAHLAAFGRDITIRIDDIYYKGPSIIAFYGTSEQFGRVQLFE